MSSSKWNNSQKLQKTPKVCKKGPDPKDPNTMRFHYYPLQAEADWTSGLSPVEASISGMTTLIAEPMNHRHMGTITSGHLSLELVLQWFPSTQSFTYTISLFVSSVFEDAVFVDFSNPPPEIPFRAGMYTWYDPATQTTVHSIIMS